MLFLVIVCVVGILEKMDWWSYYKEPCSLTPIFACVLCLQILKEWNEFTKVFILLFYSTVKEAFLSLFYLKMGTIEMGTVVDVEVLWGIKEFTTIFNFIKQFPPQYLYIRLFGNY